MTDGQGMGESDGTSEEVTSLKTKLQIMRTWIHAVDWAALCRAKPECWDWFDDDGVPK